MCTHLHGDYSDHTDHTDHTDHNNQVNRVDHVHHVMRGMGALGGAGERAAPVGPLPHGLPEVFDRAVREFEVHRLAKLTWLHAYYRNPMRVGRGVQSGGRWYRLAQEAGLPARTTGRAHSADDRLWERREVVIENDIGWRIQSMVDFMFGKPVYFQCVGASGERKNIIEAIISSVFAASGGMTLLQDIALLGHIYGHVDIVLRVDPALAQAPTPRESAELASLIGTYMRVEAIEPRRGVPIVNEYDYRLLEAYAVRAIRAVRTPVDGKHSITSVEAITADSWGYYEDGILRWRRPNLCGALPVVHIQNTSQPLEYSGLSEVEPLIPLQDELNTRLSDRASRVTLQSFKMYLAKGVHGFEQMRIGPGQVFSSENLDASVEAFGGDSHNPSEESHIREVREALDKVSGVPPLASGVVQAKIGNLSSANALRVTLMSVLSKNARKRVTYGAGLVRVCELILAAVHNTGLFATQMHERRIEPVWEDPLPQDTREVLAAAEAKVRLGVPISQVLSELGYALGPT